MVEHVETVVIGGGQAGLATSYHLTQLGREHVVLEQAAQAGYAWRHQRWDSFTLVTPNWSLRMPGAEYHGDQPDGYLARPDIVRYLEQYAEQMRVPVRYNVRVTAVEAEGDRYRVQGERETLLADNVVVATGLFQSPKIPPASASLAHSINQLHSSAYHRPAGLPPGAVLVVGSAQSGCQIAEELYREGRKVYLCVGTAGRFPRRYRGRDGYAWMDQLGLMDATPDRLPSPRAKFAANPHGTGRDGGHTINLHQFARDGVVLLGRFVEGAEHRIHLAADLHASLTKVDKFEADLIKAIDEHVDKQGISAPTETLPVLREGYAAPVVTELDLRAEGITNIIWAMGHRFDFSLVKLPVLDEDGYPQQQRGVTRYPGLYFVGLPWMFKRKSGLFHGVGEDAGWIAASIAARARAGVTG